MKRKFITDGIETIIMIVFISALVCLLCNAFFMTHEITGVSRVVNYAGIVRGSSQRAIKQELSQKKVDDQLTYLDGIIDALQHSSSRYKLIKLDSASFQSDLMEQKREWQILKKAIYTYRKTPIGKNEQLLLTLSNNYYEICDKTVSIAECYGEGIVTGLKKLEVAIGIVVGILILLSLERSRAIIVNYRNMLRLNRDAYDDPLTGVKNKRYFEEYFPVMSESCNYSLAFIDIDNLKEVNDKQGHEAGDHYIIEVIEAIREQFRTTDVIFRMGGDEFVVFLKECRESIATRLLEQAREAVHDHTSGSFSYGIVYVHKEDSRSIREILKESDQRMYEYKKAHKNDGSHHNKKGT